VSAPEAGAAAGAVARVTLAEPACRKSGPLVLRPLGPGDVAEVDRWGRDPELIRLFGAPPVRLVAEDPRFLLGIEFGGCLAGIIGLTAVSELTGSAELEVVIGPRGDRGRGIGSRAVRDYLERVFRLTDLETVQLRVLTGNRRAIRCFQRCGFRPVATLRVRHDPRYTYPPLDDDVLLMTLSRPGRPPA